jgi:hypothetical protein
MTMGKESSASSPAKQKTPTPGKERAGNVHLGKDARATSSVPAKDNSRRNGAMRKM